MGRAGKPVWTAAVSELEAKNPSASTVELDRIFYCATLQQVTSYPLKAVGLVVRKCGHFWFLVAARREQVFSVLIQTFFLALGTIGLWKINRFKNFPYPNDGKRARQVAVALILFITAVHALSCSDLRFSLPVMPLVCALGAGAVRRAVWLDV